MTAVALSQEIHQFSGGYCTTCEMTCAKARVGMEQLDFKTAELVGQYLG